MPENTAIPQTGEERRREQNRRAEAAQEAAKPAPKGPLQTDRGNTEIDETVVAKIAGMATREVGGVYAMGNSARRAFNSLTERIPGSQTNVSGGIGVEKGERQTAIDVTVIIEYGASVVAVGDAIRRNIIDQVEGATGLQVIEVNVNVVDVHLPQEDRDDTTGDRDLR